MEQKLEWREATEKHPRRHVKDAARNLFEIPVKIWVNRLL